MPLLPSNKFANSHALINLSDSWIFVGACAAFLLANSVSQSRSLFSHYLSWVFLQCSYRFLPLLSSIPSSAKVDHVNELAFTIANVIVSRSLCDVEWLTPVLPFVASQIMHHAKIPAADVLLTGSKKSKGFLYQSLLFKALAVSACFLMLPKSSSTRTVAIAIWSLISQAALFVLLEGSTTDQEGSLGSLFTQIGRLSGRVVLILTVFLIAIPQMAPLDLETTRPLRILSAAVANLVFWVALVVLISKVRSNLSALSYTCSILSVRAFQMNGLLRVAVPAAASILALSQIYLLPTRLIQSRRLFFLIASLPLTALVIQVHLTLTRLSTADSRSGLLRAEDVRGPLHPIESLALDAQKRFEGMLRKQSKTLGEAVAEYRQRYKRDPPPGFDEWFALSLENNLIFIDEFDTTMANMEVFWGVAPQDLRNRVSLAAEAENMCKVSIANKTLLNDCWYETEMEKWIDLGVHLLPDMDAVFNCLDEPRVVVMHDMLQLLKIQAKDLENFSSAKLETGPRFVKMTHQAVWDYATLSCDVGSPGRAQRVAKTLEPALSFVSNVTEATDLCLRPEIAEQHGFFVSPASLFLTNSPVPIFSQGAPSTFQDVLYPAPYYLATADTYQEDLDISYLEKADQLYWAGSTTGALVKIDNWDKLHRNRFVALANDVDDTHVLLLDQDPKPRSFWRPRRALASSLGQLFDVKFTNIVQCDNDECVELLPQYFRVGEEEDISASLNSKLVIDLDGNGYSGRFHRLLRSNSVVLKQTIFREWHDDWLVPWLHYVPVTVELGDLGEIVRFFLEDMRGYAVGQMIARSGSEWAGKALRSEDLGLAFIRILMELGRVMSDDRERLRCEACMGL